MEARIAEVLAVVIIIVCAIRGRNKGLLMEIYSLARIVLVIVLTIVLKALILPHIPDYLPSRDGVSLTIAIVASVVIVAFVDHMLQLITKIPVLSTIDRIGGILIGLVVGVLIDWLLVQFFLAFGEMEWAKQGAGAIQNSPILTYLAQLNIFS